MSGVDNILREVRDLGAYTLGVTQAPIKLNQNESPFDLPAERKAAILARVEQRAWNRYPDFHPADVLEGLGRLHGLTGDNVLIGNGSNELIQAVFAACVGAGTEVAWSVPTFSLYALMLAANQGVARQLPLAPDLSFDRDALRAVAREGRAHLLICTPNNPTGSAADLAFVAELAEATPRLVIVDEAYGPFADDDLSALVRRCDNVVVLRTFSKSVGLAGVRFGYALAHADVAREVHKVKLPYNVGLLGLEVAREVIADPSLLEGIGRAIRAERIALEAALRTLPLTVYPSAANFVLLRTDDAPGLYGWLLERGILIRDVSRVPRLEGCLRITVGTADENAAVLEAMRAWFDRRGPGANRG
jgi:histidinol-phosphate aminotransferase